MLITLLNLTTLKANALDNGIYLATATPYYSHPYTGVIEDSGGEGSSVLGQSMTESALYNQALVEVDPNGNMYATIRFQLMDNIENPQFMVQNDGYSEFYGVSSECMKEDFNNNTSDFRIQIPNESCIVRCTFYVVAMGRDVVFYIGFSNLYNGSGDFITSVEVTQPVQAQEEPQAEPQDQPIEEPSTNQVVTTQATTTTPTTTTSVSTSQSSTITTQNTTQTTTSITTDTTTTTTEVTTTPLATTQTTIDTTSQEVIGIVMFDENGNEIKELYASNDTPIEEITPSQSNSHTRVVVIVVGAVALVVVIAVTLLRKKRS